MDSAWQLRAGVAADARALARICRAARAGLGFVPEIHGEAEDIAFHAGLLVGADVLVAEPAGAPAGFVALAKGRIHSLYVAPEWQNAGLGSVLLQAMLNRHAIALDLWCFAANTGARRFYERHGFRVVEATNGAGNAEGLADVRMERRP